jgi:uncharacterized OB-fold protein
MIMPERTSVDPELFRADGERPVLLGSRCPVDKESFFPTRWSCPICLGPVEDVELSQSGVLYSYSFIHIPTFGQSQLDAEGYGVGQVDLPEGVRIQTTLNGDPKKWEIGQEMVLEYSVVSSDAEKEMVLYSFSPAS